MILANALLIVPEGQFETPVGATLRALLLDDPVHSADPGFSHPGRTTRMRSG